MISGLLAVFLRRCLTETPSAGHFCLYLMTNTRGSASIGIVKPPRSRVVYEYINQCCFQPFSQRFALRAYSSSGNTEPTTMVVHVPCLLDSYEGSRTYSVHDFLHVARSIRTETTIISCNLYRIPSLSSLYHEFLLAHVDMGVGGEKLMLIIERLPRNNGVRALFSDGGVAKDTITVVRVRENHEYWQRAGHIPLCRGTLQWREHAPHLLDIVSIANVASAQFKYYNCYARQCYWYARLILASMAQAFSRCLKEGDTSSKKWFAMFGSYNLSQVQFLVDLHTIYGHDHDTYACDSDRYTMMTGETKSAVDFIDNPDYVIADAHTPGDHVACTLTTQEPVTWDNLLTELNWFQVAVLSLTCVLAFVVAYFSHPMWEMGICSIMYCYMTGFGITTGYRRLWFHRSYTASRPLRYALALVCAGAVGGSVIWCARNQRTHHRYPDTDLDPYYAYKGLLWSYIDWIVVKPSYKSDLEESDVSDLSENDIALLFPSIRSLTGLENRSFITISPAITSLRDLLPMAIVIAPSTTSSLQTTETPSSGTSVTRQSDLFVSARQLASPPISRYSCGCIRIHYPS
ncbi:hypothetical protein EDC04DRAFT_2725318 [Pisolithus marmoratus]|nr:hypothetical protein EDC04DRAFT_2725318 [Pisolithus marmoratus]